MASKSTLYWNPICPFVQIATTALFEKGINCPEAEKAANIERVVISLEDDAPEWYTKINPKETVPCLTVEGAKRPVFESLLIAEYFDRTYGQKNTLLPPAPEIRAAIRDFQEVVNGFVQTGYGVMFSEESKRADALLASQAAAAKLEEAWAARLAAGTGAYFLGTDISLADLGIAPFLVRFPAILKAKYGYDPLANTPQLRQLRQAVRSRPSVIATSLTDAEYIKFYAGYGSNAQPVAAAKPKVTVNRASALAARLEVGAGLLGASVEIVPATTTSDAPPQVEFLGTVSKGGNAGLRLLQDTAIPALFPPDDNAAINATQFVTGEADEFAGVIAAALKSGATSEEKAQVAIAAAYIEGLVDGPFTLGKAPSMADAALVPVVYFALKALPASLAGTPKLLKLVAEAEAIPAVKAALNAIDVSVEGQARFAAEA